MFGLDLNQFIPHIIILVFTIFLIEYALQSLWNIRYFKTGITCFRKKQKKSFHEDQLPIKSLESQLKGIEFLGIPIVPSILFRKLDSNNYAFREKYWWPSIYLPVMRGLIIIKPKEDLIVYKWRMSYAPFLILIILPLIILLSFPKMSSSIFFIIFYSLSMVLQILRYLFICTLIQNLIPLDKKGRVQKELSADSSQSLK